MTGCTRRGVLVAVLTAVLVSAASSALAAARVETEVFPTTLSANELVTLQIRLRDDLRNREPELSALEADFEIEDVARSERAIIVNGHRDDSVDWIVRLRPRHEGDLTIPSVAIGNERTSEKKVIVRPPSNSMVPSRYQGRVPNRDRTRASTTSSPIIVKMETDRSNPYEQERVLVHVRLLVDAPLIEGALGEPTVEHATVEQLGEDRSFEEEVAGRVYQGVERVYSVVPERPGTLEIAPVRFEAVVPETRPRPRRSFGFGGSLFDDFFGGSPFSDDVFDRLLGGRSRRIAVDSEPLRLEVRARPAESEGQWWLPARNLTLEEHWSSDPDSAVVGRTLTREITIQAEDASAVAFPPLSLPEIEGAKQYAEAARVSEDARGARRVQDTTIIPTEAGSVTLPAVEVSWWDVEADKPRVARLPARRIDVRGTVGGTTSSPASPGSVVATEAAPSGDLAGAAPKTGARRGAIVPLSAAAGAVGALIVVVALLAYRRRRSGEGTTGTKDTLRSARRALRRACRKSDPVAAAAALRRLRAFGPTGLTETPEIREAVDRLDAVRYSAAEDEEWSGSALWNAYRASVRTAKRRTPPESGGLPPLYPRLP